MLLTILFSTLLAGTEPTLSYHSEVDKSEAVAEKYTATTHGLHRDIAYKALPALLEKYKPGPQALDFGAGTGISSTLIRSYGFNVHGIDISEGMLTQARNDYPEIPFTHITKGRVPFENATYDFIFSSLVLFEIESPEEMGSYLKEARRLLKDDALFIAVTGSEHLHLADHNWHIFNTKYPENRDPKSGDLLRIYLPQLDIEFTDYYWTEADYRKFYADAGLEILEFVYPTGSPSDSTPWQDELHFAPFVTIVSKAK